MKTLPFCTSIGFAVMCLMNDQGKLWSMIEQMEIPNYQNLFTCTYGQAKEQVLAGAYGKVLIQSYPQLSFFRTNLIVRV
jgi:hypothetical protein